MAAGELRSFVEHGIDRAAGYGIEAERDVWKYLNLMAVFGRHFDMLTLPWSKETLRSAAGPRLRLNRLYARGAEGSRCERPANGARRATALRKSGAAADSAFAEHSVGSPAKPCKQKSWIRFPAG